MLLALEKIRWLEKKLDEKKSNHEIKDFRIKLHSNSQITVFILYEKQRPDLSEFIEKNEKIALEWINGEELEEDSYYESLFQEKTSVDLGSRRRFANLIDIEAKEEIDSCPIVNFYSYKGGVGRSTALAVFASYYAIKYEKTVFIIDCDFEAPGFMNFYGLDYEEVPKNGIVELILNSQYKDEKPDLRQNYTIEISREFSGNGKIFVMPSGNLSNSVERTDYLEALARIDINSTSTIKKQFRKVIESINEEFKPDIILIDNRTGFNDVFGVMGFMFSTIIVGFFGNNRQTKPGLHFFLDTLYKIEGDTSFILVNSILPNRLNPRVKNFELEIESYLEKTIAQEIESIPTFYTYGIQRNFSLEDIGTPNEDHAIFKEFVKEDISRDYLELFEKMIELIDVYKSKRVKKTLPSAHEKKESDKIRMDILNTLYENFPEPYGENIEIDDKFLNSNFYFRECMEDIFNFDKFLLLGGKGTGKTVFYRALKDDIFLNRLQERARKEDFSFTVINIISLPSDQKEFKFLSMDELYAYKSDINLKLFPKRFWITYIWNALMLESSKTGYISKLNVEKIENNTATAMRFSSIINDNQQYIQIEEELKSLDNFLKEQNRYLILTFDQLDLIVRPHEWSEGIAPLINYWRGKPFKRISGKLFVRRDLFNKMGNLTNKELLRDQAINLEWTPEEIFAFFFKPIFYFARQPFFELMKRYEDAPAKIIEKIRDILENSKNLFQLPPEKTMLKPVVDTFFGKFAHTDGPRYGESYSWFYRNLKNADNTISLRPFIDLIKYAVEKALRSSSSPYRLQEKWILSPKFYNSAAVRENAVKRHFEDLAGEKGNQDLKCIIEFIRDKKIPDKFRLTHLYQDRFENLLKLIISENPQLQNKNIDELTKMLIDNGIIQEKYLPGGRKKYSFAFLYKYYLGLRG